MTNLTSAELAGMIRESILAVFGDRFGMLHHQLAMLSGSQQPADITFYDREPILDVRVGRQLSRALMYGDGGKAVAKALDRIKFSDGTVASAEEIWTVNPMPVRGISQQELDEADMTVADVVAGEQGETVREMIRNTYRCDTPEKLDYFLRRWIAS